MNHVNYIALHTGMSPEEAGFPQAAPPLTCSLSVMYSVSSLNYMCLSKQELPEGKAHSLEELQQSDPVPMWASYSESLFLKSWAKGRNHQLDQTPLCVYTWS